MTNQQELGEKFARSDTRGEASNVQIVEGKDHTFLASQEHAIFAKRDKESGKITTFMGWWDHGKPTSAHQLSRLGLTETDTGGEPGPITDETENRPDLGKKE